MSSPSGLRRVCAGLTVTARRWLDERSEPTGTRKARGWHASCWGAAFMPYTHSARLARFMLGSSFHAIHAQREAGTLHARIECSASPSLRSGRQTGRLSARRRFASSSPSSLAPYTSRAASGPVRKLTGPERRSFRLQHEACQPRAVRVWHESCSPA